MNHLRSKNDFLVYNNTWWSYNGESGIVIAQSLNRDADNTNTKIKMRIENNITYANINKLVYYNPSYACEDGSGNYDTTLDSYACGGRNKIVDGSGCYITRNAWDSDDSGGSNPNYFTNASGSSREESGDNKYYGTFLFANNVSYANGMNGVVVHKTDYANVYNNTVYGNGEVPSTGDPDWGSYSDAWKSALGAGRQNYSGIVVHSSSNVNVLNNISEARFDNDTAYVNYVESGWEVENVSFGSSKNFCLKSWDSFLITLPFSKCRIVWGDSITIPENLEDQEIATYKKIIEEKINECVKKAKENLNDKSL